MAYIDRNILQDYPYYGYFYRIRVDDSKSLLEQTEEKVVVYETACDITESSHSWSNNFIWAKYAVYFPFDKANAEIDIRLGDIFEADLYGISVNGKVVGVFPSQLGGVTAYVQVSDV